MSEDRHTIGSLDVNWMQSEKEEDYQEKYQPIEEATLSNQLGME